MKIVKSFLVLIFWVLLIVGCGSISDPESAVNRLEPDLIFTPDQVDSIAAVLAKFPNQTQLSLAIIRDSSVYYYGALRDDDNLIQIDNHDRVFEIGSISKVFTSTLLAHAVMEGLVEPDRPVADNLDFSIHENPQFTWLQLSNHTAGLPRLPNGYLLNFLMNMSNPYKNFDEVEVVDFLQHRLDMNYEPGTQHIYSNLGAGILGLFLGLIEEKSYEELLKEKIFDPLRMIHSTTDRESVEEDLVSGRTKRGRIAQNWDLAALVGAGGVLSTVSDLSSFIIANFDPENEVLTLQREPTYEVSENMEMAMGWFILPRDSGQRWYWHNGGTGGYRSSIVMDPDQKIGVVVLSNISAGHSEAGKIDKLSFDLMKGH